MSNEHHTGPGARARRALIVVDVQPTFCEGGALAVTGGNAVAERIAAHLSSHRGDYDLVVTTQDWHIDPGEHFSSEPDFVDTWPVHGVADSAEAQIHPALDGLVADAAVKKGQYAAASTTSCAPPVSRRSTSSVWPSPTASRTPPSTRFARATACGS